MGLGVSPDNLGSQSLSEPNNEGSFINDIGLKN